MQDEVKETRIIQIGNLRDSSFSNPTVGRVYSTIGIAPTLVTCSGGDQHAKILVRTNKEVYNMENEHYRIRRLTPRESWRLMGFADDQFERAAEQVSDTQLYKQAGNSIVVDVLYYIFKQLYQAMPYLFDDLKVGSYFSGIGAFEAALDKLFSEIPCENADKSIELIKKPID